MEGVIAFEVLNFTPYIMIYITYHDLKILEWQNLLSFITTAGSIFNVEIWTYL